MPLSAIALLSATLLFAPLRASSAGLLTGDSTSARPDSIAAIRSLPVDSVMRDQTAITSEEFTFAGAPYATLSGRLPHRESSVDLLRASLIGGAYVGMFVSLHFIQREAWWRERSPFHFTEEWALHAQIDKFGHFYGSYLQAYMFSHALIESGLDWDAATVYGALLAFLSQTYAEIEDGYSLHWGFSPSDEYANLLGAGFFVAQHYVKALENVVPRWQYVPARWSGAAAGPTGNSFIDDYGSTSLWYAFNVHNMLPEGARDYWPSWLMLSLGYGVRNADNPRVVAPTRYYTLALDYNLVELLPDGCGFWNWMRQTLNHFKLPSPTIEFGATTRFYLMFPFRMSIGDVQF